MNIWQELGIAPTREPGAIKRAYAARLKQVHPEDDPAGFQQLRAAYECAMALVQGAASMPPPAAVMAAPAAPRLPPPMPIPPPMPPPQPIPRSPAPAGPAARRPPPAAPPPPALKISQPPSPNAAARAVIELMRQTPPPQRTGVLIGYLRQPGWEQLDFQAALEHCLLARLNAQFAADAGPAEAVAGYYGWPDAARRVGRVDPLVTQIAERLKARAWLDSSPQSTYAPRRKALALLRGGVDAAAFRRFRRWSANLKAMGDVLHDLAKQPEVLRHELDQGSVKWWQDCVRTYPLAYDHLGWMLLGGSLLAWLFGAFAWQHLYPATLAGAAGRLAATGLGVLTGLSLPWVERVQAWWKRRKHDGLDVRLERQLQQWRTHKPQRQILQAASALSVTLTLGTGFSPWFALAAVPAVALLLFWSGVKQGLNILVRLSWPLHGMVCLALGVLGELFPRLYRIFPELPTLLFPHLAASFLLVPYWQAYNRLWRKLTGKAAVSPMHLFVSTCILLFASSICFAVWIPPKPLPAPSVTIPLRPPTLPNPPSNRAVPVPKAPRPSSEADALFVKAKPGFAAVFLHHLKPPYHPDRRLTMGYTVQPDGSVSEAHVISSDYHDPALESAMSDAIRKLSFPPNDSYRATSFVVTFGKPDRPPVSAR